MKAVRHLLLLLLLLLAALPAAAPPAAAQERKVALVIGNGAYQHADTLANPTNDATAVAAALRDLGFEVTVAHDLPGMAMRRAAVAFGRAARDADIALFFFAGHGLQMGTRDRAENYLVPVDAALSDANMVEDEAVSLTRILDLMADARARIVILDACRDNPLVRSMAGRASSRTVAGGLAAPASAAQGTLIAYATAPGSVAADGRGANSPFTASLIQHLPTRGAELRSVFTRVRADVSRATGGAQIPWSNDGLLSELFLAGAAAAPPAPPAAAAPPPPAPAAPLGMATQVSPEMFELTFWQSLQAAPSEAGYDEYLRRFPNGTFAGLARIRLTELRAAATQDQARRGTETADRARLAREEEDRRRAEAEQRRQEDDRRRWATERAGDEATERAMALRPQDWIEAQRLLAALGRNTGTPDGVPGPRTRAAIEAFQTTLRVPTTGFLSPALLAELRQAAAPALARQEEEARRAREADPRTRIDRAFDTGDLTALAGCWRRDNAGADPSGFREFCLAGPRQVRFSLDLRWNAGTLNRCIPWPGTRLSNAAQGELTFDLPQTTGTACVTDKGRTDFGRETYACRRHGDRLDQMSCTRTGYKFGTAEVAFTNRDLVFTRTAAAPTAAVPALTLADDHLGSPATTSRIAVGGTAQGRIETAADKDWFRIELVRGTRYRFDVFGRGLPDPLLRLHDANGRPLATDDDGGDGLNPRLTYIAPFAGTFFLAVESADGKTGAYTLTAREE